ncbi:PTS sugar transporter [Spiroplasma clarkii]|uniref:Uncharacterized protein n=1 Tax=Spiroplasma clarkii TaxID=2139 RepID=A0A1Y0L0G1_9MOLU|nr:hypothetical protein [Spiroplasma clarkii]ARU91487.1 PTS sugar transporter [Spiroplasma clarkii]ATX70905.1 hypothetical protein SCLAR_v1c05860 [Spiroplasma clarkii]
MEKNVKDIQVNKLIDYKNMINKNNVLIENWEYIDENDFVFLKKMNVNDNRTMLSKLTGSLMLLVIFIPIAAFFSIGWTALAKFTNNTQIANIFKIVSELVFLNIGVVLVFCLMYSFTNKKLFSILSSIAAQAIFVLVTSLLTTEVGDQAQVLFYKNINYNFFAVSYGFISFWNTSVYFLVITAIIILITYKFLKPLKFSGGFLNGEKLAYILTPVIIVVLTFIWILVWPGVCIGLISLLGLIARAPKGLDIFLFQILEALGQPLNTVSFIRDPLLTTSVGGSFDGSYSRILAVYLRRAAQQTDVKMSTQDFNHVYNLGLDIEGLKELYSSESDPVLNSLTYTKWTESWLKFAIEGDGVNLFSQVGDQNIAHKVLEYNRQAWIDSGFGEVDRTKLPYLYIEDLWAAGIYVTRFSATGFLSSMFILPAAAIGMLCAMNKKSAIKNLPLFLIAMLTSVLTGNTFLLALILLIASPVFFLAIYLPFMAFTGMTAMFISMFIINYNSTGLFDFIIGGVIPYSEFGASTAYKALIVGGVSFGLMSIASFAWFKFLHFNPFEYYKSAEYKTKHDVQDLVKLFGDYHNIQKAIIKNDKLYVILHHDVKLPEKNKFFEEVVNVGDNIYIFKIKPNCKATIGSFLSYISIYRNSVAMQIENIDTFREILNVFKVLEEETWEKKYLLVKYKFNIDKFYKTTN